MLSEHCSPTSPDLQLLDVQCLSTSPDLKELDEVTDEMAEAAINGVTKGASSLWNMASGCV